MPRTHGYAEKGKRCFGIHNWGAKGWVNVIGGILFAVGLFTCSVDTDVFSAWIKELLLPNFSKPTVIVMDNASFHKNQSILNLINNAGHIVEFLPAYSPDLNPIEKFWANLKRNIRKIIKTVQTL